jgi:pimeloyl-ACP methyl ester carboxylesterase
MGGEETLLLVARHPHLLAAAVAMDSVTDLARRYRELADNPGLRKLMRREVGGTPTGDPGAYAARSPLRLAAAIAASGVHLQIWWSRDDQIVRDQRRQSEALLERLLRLNPCTPVSAYVGGWAHSAEMKADALLPVALAGIGLLPPQGPLPSDVQLEPEPACAAANGSP